MGTLGKIGTKNLGGIEEVTMYMKDGGALSFHKDVEVQATAANVFVISGGTKAYADTLAPAAGLAKLRDDRMEHFTSGILLLVCLLLAGISIRQLCALRKPSQGPQEPLM